MGPLLRVNRDDVAPVTPDQTNESCRRKFLYALLQGREYRAVGQS